VDYVVPDLPPARPPKADGAFSIRPSVVLLGDHTFITQDDSSVAQVGAQRSRWEMRAARLQLLGHVGRDFRVRYQIAAEYKGFDGDPETDWTLTDLNISLPLGPRTTLQLGKAKEPFVYEMVGDAANLPASERVLSPFFVSRNTGARLTHVWGPARRGTLSLGLHNDAWDIGTSSSAERGWDVSGRLTALLWDDPAGPNFLHLGASFRSVASASTLRYRGRPGSNVTTNFVDTGNLPADGAFHYAVEGLLNLRNVSVLGEWVAAEVDSPATGNPRFSGWYLAGSWVLTGENRPYDRNVGYARRVIPAGRWGAPELVVRYADVDLRDSQVDGGRFTRWDLGVNWWATTRWKFGAVYGLVHLDRDGQRGRTDTFLTRIQWIY
jgi:phosphate-selective porin OprO/OprP